MYKCHTHTPLSCLFFPPRHHFSSALQRMSAVAIVRGLGASSARPRASALCLVKGSPEALSTLLREGSQPAWYNATYRSLAEQGLRVLALGYKVVDDEGADAASAARAAAKRPRDWVESDLTFAGFVAFGCAVRRDSAAVIASLRQSRHATIMLTGDAALTAIHVAKQVGMLSGEAVASPPSHRDSNPRPPVSAPGAGTTLPHGGEQNPPPILLLEEGSEGSGVARFGWRPALASCQSRVYHPFSVGGVAQLVDSGHALVVTGRVWDALVACVPSAWAAASQVAVYARMSPEGKEAVVCALRERGIHTLMCGDGGNDVGALKASRRL